MVTREVSFTVGRFGGCSVSPIPRRGGVGVRSAGDRRRYRLVDRTNGLNNGDYAERVHHAVVDRQIARVPSEVHGVERKADVGRYRCIAERGMAESGIAESGIALNGVPTTIALNGIALNGIALNGLEARSP